MVHELNYEQVYLLIQELEQVIESKQYQIPSDSDTQCHLQEDNSENKPEINSHNQF